MASFTKWTTPNVAMDSVEYSMLASLRQSIERITRTAAGTAELAREHHLRGVFISLTQADSMRAVLFPGTPPEILKELPTSLREILQWPDLTLEMSVIAKNASDVLKGIKNKGAKAGDVMDAMTEQLLIPQIAQEALARALIDAVRKLNRRVSQTVAKQTAAIACDSEQAALDQLDEEVVAQLLLPRDQPMSQQTEPSADHAVGYAHQLGYMGPEWAEAVRADVLRFRRDEPMSPMDDKGEVAATTAATAVGSRGKASMISWVECDAVQDSYPALAEALSLLRALPHELNSKAQAQGEGLGYDLLEPMKGCCLLVHYPAGARQMARLDSREDQSDLDSGIRITCAYHLREEGFGEEEQERDHAKGGGELVFKEQRLPLQDDMLTIHRSTSVQNARTADRRYGWFAVYLFIHGRDSSKSSGKEGGHSTECG